MIVQVPTPGLSSSDSIYGIARNAIGQPYNVINSNFETWNPLNWDEYGEDCVAQEDGQMFLYDVPFNLPIFNVCFFLKLGLIRSKDDKMIGIFAKSVQADVKATIQEVRTS